MSVSEVSSFGVYIHIPFCAQRCDYCAFATWTDRHHLIADYATACRADLERATGTGLLVEAGSVFVGGGTPSQMPGATLAQVLEMVPLSPGAEVTVECNPEDADADLFEQWRRAGVNRVSLGAQSAVPHVLEGLGRSHRPGAVARAVRLVGEAGFDSFNLDLIMGGATETDDDWRRTLEFVLGLDPRPPHISAYGLMVEPGTPLARDPARHPDEDEIAGRYEIADSVLGDAGLDWYEVSNWASAGHECRHNQLYWNQGDYLGIGCSAHSHMSGRRWWSVRTPERYISLIASGGSTLAGEEDLDVATRSFEAGMLELRTRQGIDVGRLAAIEQLVADDLVVVKGQRAILTLRGRLLANEVSTRITPG